MSDPERYALYVPSPEAENASWEWTLNWPYSNNSTSLPSWMRFNSSYSTLPSLPSAKTKIFADLKFEAVVPIPVNVDKVTVLPPLTTTLDEARLTKEPVNPEDCPIVVLPTEVAKSPISSIEYESVMTL